MRTETDSIGIAAGMRIGVAMATNELANELGTGPRVWLVIRLISALAIGLIAGPSLNLLVGLGVAAGVGVISALVIKIRFKQDIEQNVRTGLRLGLRPTSVGLNARAHDLALGIRLGFGLFDGLIICLLTGLGLAVRVGLNYVQS